MARAEASLAPLTLARVRHLADSHADELRARKGKAGRDEHVPEAEEAAPAAADAAARRAVGGRLPEELRHGARHAPVLAADELAARAAAEVDDEHRDDQDRDGDWGKSDACEKSDVPRHSLILMLAMTLSSSPKTRTPRMLTPTTSTRMMD